MPLPPLREKGDVGEQVDRGLEDIERVIAAEIVKAVLRVAALNVAAICLMRFSLIRAAARTPAREPLLSRASAGQMHGSMGAAMSQSRRMTFFFLAESIFAIFAAVTVFPLPGLPQTASIPPLSFCSSGFSVSR